MTNLRACLSILTLATSAAVGAEPAPTSPLDVHKADGYRGIWYSNQRQNDEYVYKYSGGLGTYCAKHRPLAVYSPEANKTFFCYGGTLKDKNQLVHAVSYYDHATGRVPRPTVLLNKGTDDAHDNPVISLDARGHVWIFSSSHGTARPSYVSVSKKPYDVNDFERVLTTNFSYTQPYHIPGQGFFFPHTIYRGGRCLYQMRSPDGRTWTEPELLSKIEQGHYEVTWCHGSKVGAAFNFHPKPKGLNWRTNLYYMETDDLGKTWRNAQGQPIELPITEVANPALVPMLYESTLRTANPAGSREGWPVPSRHPGGNLVAFVDGSIRSMTVAPSFSVVKATPASRGATVIPPGGRGRRPIP